MPPSMFRMLDDEDKAIMMALEIASNKMMAYDRQISQAAMEKK